MNCSPAFVLTLLLLLAPLLADSQVIGSSGGGWTITGTDPIEISFAGQLVTAYNPGFDAGKPYFYPIIGPTGENMTRHWPMKQGENDEETDDIHHRGMWYGLGQVNGLDFWHSSGDEAKKGRAFGIIRHRGMTGVIIKGPTITFRTRSDWVDASNPEQRICSDQREFTLFYREDGSLVIDLTLTLNADAGDVTIGDDENGAWAIRTLPTLQLKGKVAAGQIINSEGLADAEVQGGRAAWADYYGSDRAGNPVGIAILDHRSNLRHPTWWNTRDDGLFTANPFGQGRYDDDAPENAGEYTIPNGDSLPFRYRAIFHRGDTEAAGIAKAYELFSSK